MRHRSNRGEADLCPSFVVLRLQQSNVQHCKLSDLGVTQTVRPMYVPGKVRGQTQYTVAPRGARLRATMYY
ncbi:hypothetical protein EJB05_27692, partial [Eragrostis curvula]